MLRHHVRNWRLRAVLLLSVIGPGVITASVDNDPGGIYTYSVAGAQFGYSLLWTLLPTTVALVVVQEMAARMGTVTGKGLSDLIREEYGFRVTFFMMMGLVAANFGTTVAEFAGLASGMKALGVSRFVAVPLGAILVWALVVKGSYRMVQNIFLAACCVYVAYPVSCFLAQPEWGHAVVSAVKPTFHFTAGYIYMILALVGTTIAPWQQFYLQAAVVEKGTKVRHYALSRWDVIMGCIITGVIAFFIIVACAATIYAAGPRQIRDAGDAALALRPVAGHAASALFAFGLSNAALLSACILPLSTAFCVCEGFGLESGVRKRMDEAPVFYWLYTGLVALSALVVLGLSESRQVRIILHSQVANGVLLPFVMILMLRLINRPDLMGTYRNNRGFNIIAWITSSLMIALTLLLVVSSFFPGRLPA